MFVHSSALVEEGAVIGTDTKIWHQCQVRRNAHIGSECILGRGVYVDEGVHIGNRVKIQNYVSIYHGVTIEDGVFVGPHVCFTNDLWPRAVNPDMSLKSAEDWTVSETRVCAGASIGANATLVCGITVGRWALVGAGSVVVKDVPDYALVVGNPARVVGYVSACGKRKNSQLEAQNCPDCMAVTKEE
jgi:acetyltransferase-like isoleucine patch superfamily enzyme